MTFLRHHLRHTLRVSRCSAICSSLLLFLYSLLLFLVSVPIASTLTVHPTHPSPTPPSPPPPPTSSSDDPSPLTLHSPILSLLPCYGVYELKGRRHYMEDTHAIFADQQLYVSRLAAQSTFAREALSAGVKREARLLEEEEGQEEGKVVVGGSSADGARSDWVLFGVFDGHGGHDASAYTATHLLPLIHTNLTAYQHSLQPPAVALPSSPPSSPLPPPSPYLLPPSHNLSSLFRSTFQQLDSSYLHHPLAHHHTHPHADGSTAIVVAIQRLPITSHPTPHILVANAGDCRALLVSEDSGQGKELTTLTPSWLDRLGGMCRKQAGQDDSDSEDEEERGWEPQCVEGDGEGEEEEEEEELDDAKTAEITAAELLQMYHHFHPNHSHSTKPTLSPPSPSSSPSASPLFFPLSIDHKPHLPVERAYITSLPSGFITTSRYHSISRVQGVLATSRAIGDYELKPWVRCEPDVVVWGGEGEEGYGGEGGVRESGRPRWVVIGSDGFFDAWSSEGVSGWVREMGGRGMHVQRMAKELVKAAYKRGSDDNITVIVVDLACIASRSQAPRDEDPPAPS